MIQTEEDVDVDDVLAEDTEVMWLLPFFGPNPWSLFLYYSMMWICV